MFGRILLICLGFILAGQSAVGKFHTHSDESYAASTQSLSPSEDLPHPPCSLCDWFKTDGNWKLSSIRSFFEIPVSPHQKYLEKVILLSRCRILKSYSSQAPPFSVS